MITYKVTTQSIFTGAVNEFYARNEHEAHYMYYVFGGQGCAVLIDIVTLPDDFNKFHLNIPIYTNYQKPICLN